jgi:hypothetical protein
MRALLPATGATGTKRRFEEGFMEKNWFKRNLSEIKPLQMKRFFLTILVNFVSSKYEEDVKTSKKQRCQKPVKRG